MFKDLSNTMFTNTINKVVTIARMHETMERLYKAAKDLAQIEGQSALARYLDETPQTVNNWEARGISKAGIIKANQKLGVEINWLKTGIGRITQRPLGAFEVNHAKLAMVPVVGKSMGGLPERIFLDEGRTVDGFDDYAEVFSADSNAFVVRVDGSSMYPKYTQGEYALVEPNTDPEPEDDVLVRLTTGEVMLKRLISRRGSIRLGSYNETNTYTFSKEQITWMYYVAYPVPSRKIKSRL